MRNLAVLALALLATAAVAEDKKAPPPAPVLEPAGHKGPDGNWPVAKGPKEYHGLPELTDAGRLALEVLLRAERFTDAAVGIAGVTPLEVECIRVLHRDPAAAKGFLHLARKGSPAGKLWGLCGLWYWNPSAFEREMATVLREHGDEKVKTMRGCIVSEEAVRNIIRVPEAIAIVLKDRTDTCKAWFERTGDSRSGAYDIAGGGWPCVMRSDGGW